MNTDKFFSIAIVDRFSRMLMLLFAGITLGAVLALAYYIGFGARIDYTIIMVAIYCVLFSTYVSVSSSKRKVSKVEIFKEKLSFVFEKKWHISSRCDIKYSDIQEYKISPLSDKKNMALEAPNKDKFLMRVFGFQTKVKLKDGRELVFQDGYTDGVLMYSPSYIYRMLDVKRFIPDFPLVLENFDAKKDTEDFDKQFKYYLENEANLPLHMNKKYMLSLLKYTIMFVAIAIAIVLFIGCMINIGVRDEKTYLMFMWVCFGILASIMVPTYLVALGSSFFGGIVNKEKRNIIRTIIQE